MAEAYIIDAVRTPIGRKKGSLAHLHPADLGAHPIKALVERTGIDANAVDDVVWGCCDTIGPQAGDIGRTVWLVAGLPLHVPGTTIDRQCGSSQQAVHFAAQGVMSGTQDLVVAGGSQAMNAIPISAAMYAGQPYGFDNPFNTSKGWVERFGDGLLNQINSAEMIARKWQISREEMEAFALASHQRAHAASEGGLFKGEIAPLEGLEADETIRPGTTLEGLVSLKTVQEGGVITAGVASQNCDGAAALLIASEQAVKDHGLKPRARIHHISVRADDPVWMLTAPIPATQHALKKAGMTVADIDLFECNEAFASVPLAWMKELGIPHEKVNVRGGAIALGHPLGGTGARLMTTLLNALEATGGRYGLQTMCEGGGQANVTIIERL
ncbi:acetyl-CoA C-acetyltransferase [Novosphingobium sp.]|uniref:acetyl-CoA C-acetyltransferase n=1 Tax=Novosphingobium sp. TaxID=1874826 RepID=UPI0022C05A42|nr:acetyl-CoA C-acetyltransferase [Novosphingobium sp.]MCZ8018378.1 acetyl-CoA C-acetyltransferase [Novosphingobium sp.]MCZ8033372.1 acetyl-CoA C-acetyltransferase [Novosphingobium sp.]MCZ8051827.1 acetyl-CoA C-acetyltransferase [Novosphingobium sp.]MCZ8060369.1 acetyl-CoA C-acetyltransferase [Novosphingobium sp.]MCZ8232011.1 acetyl-CoA C-acetyltransferase [Novosphingobium sp.]